MKIITRSLINNLKLITLAKGNCKSNYSGSAQGNISNMTCSALLNSIPKVDIDPSGVFKYILIKVYDNNKGEECCEEPFITIVRGYARCNYHSDIYEEVEPKLQPFESEPIGGGRISQEPNNKKIHIYGYSQGYGKADHEITAKLIKDAYPSYAISISDEGY